MWRPEPTTCPKMRPGGTLGDLAAAAFLLAAISGMALAVPFDAANGFRSIATLLLANPPAVFFRNLHYWSGQACLVFGLLHTWEHLAAGTERRVSRAVWFRLTVSLGVLVFLMLSGFLLRGDADAIQAQSILKEVAGRLPLAGKGLGTLLFGAGGRLEPIYIQHAATATLVLGLVIVEHARRVWPRPAATLAVTGLTGALSLFLSPGLHDGLAPAVKGPWYFLGLQELLHWTSNPLLALAAGAGGLVALLAVREAGPAGSAALKRGLALGAGAYLALCAVGGFLRGEAWRWQPGLPAGPGDLRVGLVFRSTPNPPAPLPMVQGRPEGCLVCHPGVTGLGKAHKPEAIGCASCHGGDPLTLVKARAHQGMERIPGSLGTAALRCGQNGCHGAIVPRVERSVMATMSGVIQVDRSAFGEPAGDAPHVQRLGATQADTHLRQLCAPCHLGRAKATLGPPAEDELGGGCLACHLTYSPEARAALRAYQRVPSGLPAEPPKVHPALSLDVDNDKCFGCHNRSGRISLSYEGWAELQRPEGERSRTLPDGRVLTFIQDDVHHQKGMDCIDCHSPREIMGDGRRHARKRTQLQVQCEDCHPAPGTARLPVTAKELDPETRTILQLRPWATPAPRLFPRTASGQALMNGNIDPDTGRAFLVGKRTGRRWPLNPARPVCQEGGHRNLSCGSCHSAWTPRCNGCHTYQDLGGSAYDWLADADVTGAWREKGEDFRAQPPTLGMVSTQASDNRKATRVETFAPGMVARIDLPGPAGASRQLRLFARVEPHTTRAAPRPCQSCHNDPVALGYGRGDLAYLPAPRGGRWRFTPSAPIQPDGLPGDAWTPFLGTRRGWASTYDGARPFTPDEQRRILQAGACLTCHDGRSKVMGDAVRDFQATCKRRSPRCIVPVWD